MKVDLSDKIAIVTGSTAGIGFAIAQGLAEAGAAVVVNGRKQAGVESDRTFVFPHDFSTLIGDADDSRTRLSWRLLFNYREDLFKPFDLLLGLAAVLLKRRL